MQKLTIRCSKSRFFLGGSAPEPPSVTSFELVYNTWISKKNRPAAGEKISFRAYVDHCFEHSKHGNASKMDHFGVKPVSLREIFDKM